MGRGLDAILPPGGRENGLRVVPVELIDPNPRQPRQAFDSAALGDLAESIRARGVLQPIVVRGLPGGRYELVAGSEQVPRHRQAHCPEADEGDPAHRRSGGRCELASELAEP